MIEVFQVLLNHDTWMGAAAVGRLAGGLNAKQVHLAVADLRDANPDIPINTKKGPRGGYWMTNNEDAQIAYRLGHFGTISTMTTRYQANMEREIQRLEANPVTAADARRLRISLERLVQDIAVLAV